MANVATIGGGCFWCLEPLYKQLMGITEVVSGYAGGTYAYPTYEDLLYKKTGHAEVIQVTYDPDIITYWDILEIFYAVHDPTTKNRQGNDVGEQYRSIILFDGDVQEKIAREVTSDFAVKKWGDRVVTEIKQLDVFYPAEKYHQNYFELNPEQAYCQVIINPKLNEFRKKFAERLKN